MIDDEYRATQLVNRLVITGPGFVREYDFDNLKIKDSGSDEKSFRESFVIGDIGRDLYLRFERGEKLSEDYNGNLVQSRVPSPFIGDCRERGFGEGFMFTKDQIRKITKKAIRRFNER